MSQEETYLEVSQIIEDEKRRDERMMTKERRRAEMRGKDRNEEKE